MVGRVIHYEQLIVYLLRAIDCFTSKSKQTRKKVNTLFQTYLRQLTCFFFSFRAKSLNV